MFKDNWTNIQKKQVLSYARQHFTPYAAVIKQNYYVLEKALEVIGVFDDNFTDFCTDYMKRTYGNNTKLKDTIIQSIIRYEKDDKKIADFLEGFSHVSDFDKSLSILKMSRFGITMAEEN